MGQTPRNRVFYRTKHVFPTDSKGIRHILPAEPFRPAGKEPAEGRRQRTFSFGPRHLLHRHAALRAVHPPHRVDEEHGNLPERHKLEPPPRQPVVARSLAATTGTDRSAVGPRLDRHLDRQPGCFFRPLGFSVNKRLVSLDAIEDTLQLHPVLAPGEMVGLLTPSLPGNLTGCIYSLTSLPRYTGSCLVKRNRALLASNLTRDNQIKAGE